MSWRTKNGMDFPGASGILGSHFPHRSMQKFELVSEYAPAGDQPEAIEALVQGLDNGERYQTLLGVTGSGKTFTMANVIAQQQRPALVIAHNKTLAAQLAQEFKEFFPKNAVHYFVSYYDYYQPEAFVVKTGTYIEKEATINDEIDRLRHAATESLLTRKDVIIVASVSCIYGIGDVRDYENQVIVLHRGENYQLEHLIERLVSIQYVRTTTDFENGTFRIQGDTIDIFPPGTEHYIRLQLFDEELEMISCMEPLTNKTLEHVNTVALFPAKHFVTTSDTLKSAMPLIRQELDERLEVLRSIGKPLEAERLKAKTEYDLEMLQETGYVNGIENYSMYLSGRTFGDPPSTLMQFFPENYLAFVDESHMTLPQVRGMHAGDRARKTSLVEHGFRLPSALENRPLQFNEFERCIHQAIFVSATPSEYELNHSPKPVEQIIRPTGLLDPEIIVEDMEYMTDDLLSRLQDQRANNERSIVTTLTKKSSEELALFLAEHGYKVSYLHSEIETVERLEILRSLRLGNIEVIVGVNLMRE